jgi:cold shock CspA family protein
MTGIIVALAGSSRTGTIRIEDGSFMVFSAASVLGDFESLTLGDRVSFDAERDRPHNIAVRVFREPFSVTASGGKHAGSPDLRYAGFDQANNIRSYRFDAISYGHSVRHCVTVDLALLLKYRIGVQEAPALCLHKLATDLSGALNSGPHQLGASELEAFASSRDAVLQRKKPKFPARRGSPPPGSSQDRGTR